MNLMRVLLGLNRVKMRKVEKFKLMSSREEKINRLWNYLLGFFACWIIGIGSRLNLFEAIRDWKNGISTEELMKRLKLEYHLVNIWCKVAYSFELLDLGERGNFRIDNSMDSFLINSPEC